MLEERPLGPFDVADVLLAAFDAHLHLRDLTVADHAKGFTMTLKIGGVAAVLGGVAWAAGIIWTSTDGTEDPGVGIWLYLAGTALLLLALVGLSAFQAREHPRLVWAAFIVPALGAIVTATGALMMTVPYGGTFLAAYSGWDFWFVGMVALLVGSGLFALASWRTGSVSRAGSALLGAAALVFLAALPVATGLVSVPWEPVSAIVFLAVLVMFAAGWVVLGIGAIRRDRPVSLATSGGA